MNNFTIMIQGPWDQESVDKLDVYKKYGQIIYSVWEHPKINELPDYIKVVSNIMPNKGHCYCCNKKMPNLIEDSTIAWAVSTTFAGLQEVETDYVIKIRSDEYYTQLQPLIDKFLDNTNKVVFGNIFCRSFKEHPYHMGDHLFVGQTSILLQAYKHIFDDAHNFSSKINKYYLNYMGCGAWPAESMLACNIMRAMKLSITPENFIKAFDVIDINILKPFVAKWQHQNRKYINFFDCKFKTMKDFLND